jgi:hypothetical protein
MKTIATILFAATLSVTAAFAGALPRNDTAAKKAAPQLPFRPNSKRPVGTAAVSGDLSVAVATPTLPFRPYQKRPAGRASTGSTVEVASRK